VLKMAENWRPTEAVKHSSGRVEKRLLCGQGWCRYYLGLVEGSKRTDYVYFPLAGRMRVSALSYRQLKDGLRKLGVQAKLYRKFAN